MQGQTITLTIKAAGQSFLDFTNRARQAWKTFNDQIGNGRRMVSGLRSELMGLAGIGGTVVTLGKLASVLQEGQAAAYNMETSLKAANREFGNIGSAQKWETTIRRLSDELQIYSDTALKNAVSRTVDMTKRLGLSKDQMEEVIRRSADLGAGKVELEGAIERVTAALRGEAESAEFLGLTLNENYVKTIYESANATGVAWEKLTDLEKAQVRYQAFLQQTAEIQGRAAGSVKTFGGALALVRKEVENAVTSNKEIAEALNQVASMLRQNAGHIGKFVADIITLTAKTIQFVAEWKNVVLAILGTAAAVSVVGKLVTVITALNAVMTGMGIISWFRNFIAVANAAVAATTGFAGALGKAALFAVAAWSADKVAGAIAAFVEWRAAAAQAGEAQDRLRENADRLMRKYEDFKNVKLPNDLTKLAQQELDDLRDKLAKARAYYTTLQNQLETKAQEKTWLGTFTDEAMEAQRQLADVNARLQEIQEGFQKVGEVATGAAEAMKKPAQAVAATTEQLDEFEKQARKSYEEARKQAEDYAKKAIEWEEKIKYARLSTQDKIRELNRKGLDEELAWNDRRRQAEEKLSSAKQALAQNDYELAEKLAKDAESLYADLANEVKKTEGGKDVVVQSIEETKQVAINGITEVGRFVEDLYGKQKTAAETAAAQWTATADGIKQHLDEIAKEREANVQITLRGLESAQNAINALTRDETKHITVVTHHVEANAAGGLAGLALGGKLSGYGGGDRINAKLEAGEFVIRKEAVAKYGAALFDSLNSMKLDLTGMVRARIGGLFSNLAVPAMPEARFAFQEGGMVPGAGARETMTIRFQAGAAEMPLTVVGSTRVTRSMVKQFEKELIKMGLSKG